MQLKTRVPDAQMATRRGTGIGPDDMAVELHSDADVYMPNGQLLCMLRRGIVSKDARSRAIDEFRWMKKKYITDNRGAYSGYDQLGSDATLVRKDGRVSRQTRTMDGDKVVSVSSAIVGYYGRTGRHPYCRQTAFTQNEPQRWANVLPLVHEVSDHMKDVLPKKWAIQDAFAKTVSQDFRIRGTVFSTLTVNNNVCGTVHKDKGDFKAGFGVIGCFREGEYTGGHLCFPQYKVFVDFKDSDLLFFNPHEWHGVNPMVHTDPENEGVRVTVVYYFRENLCDCEDVNGELARTRMRFGDVDDPDANRGRDVEKLKVREKEDA
jgi:hypothetical protein